MNSVSCLAWVKRGASKRNPDRVVLNDEDLKKVIDVQSDKLRKLEVGDEESDSDSDSEDLPHKSAAASRNKVCTCTQGGHGTGKTGNLDLTFSRQGKHREFCCNTGKVFETQGKYF